MPQKVPQKVPREGAPEGALETCPGKCPGRESSRGVARNAPPRSARGSLPRGVRDLAAPPVAAGPVGRLAGAAAVNEGTLSLWPSGSSVSLPRLSRPPLRGPGDRQEWRPGRRGQPFKGRGLRSAPKGPRMAPGRPRRPPRRPQEGPKTGPEASKTPKMASKTAKMVSKMPPRRQDSVQDG